MRKIFTSYPKLLSDKAIFLPNIDILIPYFVLFEKKKEILKRFHKKLIPYLANYQEGILTGPMGSHISIDTNYPIFSSFILK